MGGLTRGYFIQRLLMFFLTIWIGVSLTFAIPRLSGSDPTTAMLLTMMNARGYVENADKIIAAYKESFGLNDPIGVQYMRYLWNVIHFDYGFSFAKFPAAAWSLVTPALPGPSAF